MDKKTIEVPRGKGVSGPTGLLTAVIATAVNDATGTDRKQKADSLRYFASDTYERHLDWLGVPWRLPTVFRKKGR